MFQIAYIAVVGFILVHIAGLHNEEEVYDDDATLISYSPGEETINQAIAR